MTYLLNQMEHRWGDRVQVDLPIHLAVHTQSRIVGRIKNLSLSGALIRTDLELRMRSLIRVFIAVPLRLPHEAIIQAHVVRVLNGDAGIEWSEFAPSAVKELLQSTPTGRMRRS
jgi:hypothetical protein